MYLLEKIMKFYTAVIASFLQNTFLQHFSWISTEFFFFLQLNLLLTKNSCLGNAKSYSVLE